MAVRATCTTECLRADQQRHIEDFAVYTVPMLCNTPASRAGCLTQCTVHALEAPVRDYPEARTHLATTYHGEPCHGEQTNYASDTHGERGYSAPSEVHVATLDFGLEHSDTHTQTDQWQSRHPASALQYEHVYVCLTFQRCKFRGGQIAACAGCASRLRVLSAADSRIVNKNFNE